MPEDVDPLAPATSAEMKRRRGTILAPETSRALTAGRRQAFSKSRHAPELAASTVQPLKRQKGASTSLIQTGFAQLGNTDESATHGYYLLRYDNVGDTVSFDGANHFHRTLSHYECLCVDNWPVRTSRARGLDRREATHPTPQPELVEMLQSERAALASESAVTADILADEHAGARRPVLRMVQLAEKRDLDDWKRVLGPGSTLSGWSSYPFNQSKEPDAKKRAADQKARSFHIPLRKLKRTAAFWRTEAGKAVKVVLDGVRATFPEHCGGPTGQPRDAHLLLQTRDGGPTAFTFHKDLQHSELDVPFQRSICVLLAKGTDELLKIAFFF